jgi:hypothetical protein
VIQSKRGKFKDADGMLLGPKVKEDQWLSLIKVNAAFRKPFSWHASSAFLVVSSAASSRVQPSSETPQQQSELSLEVSRK